MKNHFPFSTKLGAILLAVSTLAALPVTLSADEAGQIFATPEDAVAALSRAATSTNRAVLGTIFGTAVKQLVNPDEVQGALELADFAAAFAVTNRLVRESDNRMLLEVGPNS